MIKEQQEAFSKKGQKTAPADNEPPLRTGNLAAERMRMIKEQQDAFSKKGQSNSQGVAAKKSLSDLP